MKQTNNIALLVFNTFLQTLAFVLPVLNALSKRRVLRLRALVVLPSRDLGEWRNKTLGLFNYPSSGCVLKIMIHLLSSVHVIRSYSSPLRV